MPGHPRVTQFLRGDERELRYGGGGVVRRVGLAREFASLHFNGRFCRDQAHNAHARADGRGCGAFVAITKTKLVFEEQVWRYTTNQDAARAVKRALCEVGCVPVPLVPTSHEAAAVRPSKKCANGNSERKREIIPIPEWHLPSAVTFTKKQALRPRLSGYSAIGNVSVQSAPCTMQSCIMHNRRLRNDRNTHSTSQPS